MMIKLVPKIMKKLSCQTFCNITKFDEIPIISKQTLQTLNQKNLSNMLEI